MVQSLGFYKYSDLVPLWDNAEDGAFSEVVAQNQVIRGDQIAELRIILKRIFKVKYVILTNHGRTALYLGLKAMNFKVGSKIIVPSFICGSVIEAIVDARLSPIFIDINKKLELTKEKINSANGKAVIIPSFGGKASEAIATLEKKNSVKIIDDAAQAFGAETKNRKIGTFGNFGILSFNIGKNLVAGAGGALLTNSKEVYEKVKKTNLKSELKRAVIIRFILNLLRLKFRRYTRPLFFIIDKLQKKPEYCKISNLDASIIIEQIKKSDVIITSRKRNARYLQSKLASFPLRVITGNENIFTKFFVELTNANDLNQFRKFLRRKGVETEKVYFPNHLKTKYKSFETCGSLNVTEKLAPCVCSLPINPSLKKSNLDEIVNAVKEFFMK